MTPGQLLQGAVLGKQGLRFNLSARQLFTGDDEYTIEVQLWCWRGWSFGDSVVVVVVECSLCSTGAAIYTGVPLVRRKGRRLDGKSERERECE